MLKQILNDDLLIDGNLKVNGNEIIYTIDKKSICLSSDLQYRLLLQGFNKYHSEEAMQSLNASKLHYLIENMDFYRPMVLLSNGKSVIEFKNCYFHSTVSFLKADEIILNNCKYYINGSKKNNCYMSGHINCLKIENENSKDRIKQNNKFNMSLYAEEKIDIINSKVGRNQVSLYTKNLNISNSEVMFLGEDSEISSENLYIKDSNLLVDDLHIKTDNMQLLDSKLNSNQKLVIFTDSECDLNLLESPILEYNGISIRQKVKVKN